MIGFGGQGYGVRVRGRVVRGTIGLMVWVG